MTLVGARVPLTLVGARVPLTLVGARVPLTLVGARVPLTLVGARVPLTLGGVLESCTEPAGKLESTCEETALKGAGEDQALEGAGEMQALEGAGEEQALEGAGEVQALEGAGEEQALEGAVWELGSGDERPISALTGQMLSTGQILSPPGQRCWIPTYRLTGTQGDVDDRSHWSRANEIPSRNRVLRTSPSRELVRASGTNLHLQNGHDLHGERDFTKYNIFLDQHPC